MIHLKGGSFTAPHPSGDTKSDTAIIVNENFGIKIHLCIKHYKFLNQIFLKDTGFP